MGNDRPAAFSVEYFPPAAGNPVPKGFQPSFADHIYGIPADCHSDSFTARICIKRSNKAVVIMQNLTERLSLLTMFYLFFDLLALMIVIIRNIG